LHQLIACSSFQHRSSSFRAFFFEFRSINGERQVIQLKRVSYTQLLYLTFGAEVAA